MDSNSNSVRIPHQPTSPHATNHTHLGCSPPGFLTRSYLSLSCKYENGCDSSGRSVQPIWVEIDSLLLDIATNVTDKTQNGKSGGQQYAMVNRCEERLREMQDGHREVHVFFLDTTRPFLPPHLLLARETMYHRLKGQHEWENSTQHSTTETGEPDICHGDAFVVHTFTSITSKRFWDTYRRVLPSMTLITTSVETGQHTHGEGNIPCQTHHCTLAPHSWNDAILCASSGSAAALTALYQLYTLQLLISPVPVSVYRTSEAAVLRREFSAFLLRINKATVKAVVESRISIRRTRRAKMPPKIMEKTVRMMMKRNLL